MLQKQAMHLLFDSQKDDGAVCHVGTSTWSGFQEKCNSRAELDMATGAMQQQCGTTLS